MNDENQDFTPCEDCPRPNGCIDSCAIKNYKQEDVAEIRGEKE